MAENVTIEAKSVSIETDSVVVGKAKEPPSVNRKWIYFCNALFFAVTMVLLTVWFDAHLESYLTHLAILGTVTLFAIAEMFLSWKDLIVKREDIQEKLLAQSSTSVYIAVAFVTAVVLLAMTKSVYVKLGKSDAAKVLIEVRESDTNTLIDTLRLDDTQRIAGHPMFFSLARQKVKLVAIDPRGYEDLPLTVNWRTEPAIFPFNIKHYHIMRILPSIAAKAELPDTDEPGVTLTVTIDSFAYAVPNFRRNDIAYVGAAEDVLRYLRTKHQDEFEKEYFRRLVRANITDDNQLKTHMSALGETIHDQNSREPAREVVATIHNGNIAYTGRRTIAKDAPEIETIYLEKMP